MRKAVQVPNIPELSIVTHEFGNISYFDVFKITRPLDESIDQLATDMFTLPAWGTMLMRIRNAVVRPFGLKTSPIEKAETLQNPYYPINSQVGPFTVLLRSDDEIVIGQNDKHLQFRASVYADKQTSALYLITVVTFLNIYGRMYFLVVRPFHKLIVRTALQRTKRLQNGHG